MFWTQAKAVAVLAAVVGGATAQGFLASLSEQVAAWMIPPASTTSSSTSQAGSPPIGGPATAGGGDGPSAAGTMIISWSTQYFTVTTGGPPDGVQQTWPITDGGSMDSFPTGSLDTSQAPGSGSITSGTGTISLSGDSGSGFGPVNTNGGSIPPIPSESLGPSGSISEATGASTITDGFPGESPLPGSTDDGDDGWIASILAGSPDTPQDPVPGDIYGDTETPGFSGSSQAEPMTNGGGTETTEPPRSSQEAEPITDGGGGSVPTITTEGPAAPQAPVPGTSPSESALPPPDIFVVQLGPAGAGAGAGAAIESGAAGPLGRRKDNSDNDDNNDNEFLMNAGTERSGDCSQATQFEIIDGELTRGGQKVSTSPGLVGSAQRLAVSPSVGSVTRSWEIVDGELLWLNDSFVGGRAAFCVDDDTRAVLFSTMGEGSEPVGCTPQRLTPMFVADCPGLNPDGSVRSLLPAEETLILPPGIYFPGREPENQACRVTTGYWTVGQFTLAPAPTELSSRL